MIIGSILVTYAYLQKFSNFAIIVKITCEGNNLSRNQNKTEKYANIIYL